MAQNGENDEILVRVYPCRFWRHPELGGHKKSAASRIVQMIWNCRAVVLLDFLL